MGELTLVIMAAGMGSRFGGAKQIASVDDIGRSIMDYSVFDGVRCGFSRVVFIIRESLLPYFSEVVIPRMRKMGADADIVIQSNNMTEYGYPYKINRIKPFGTAHAVASLYGRVEGRFALINADDFYGSEGFSVVAEHLMNASDEGDMCTVAYRLKSTLSPSGGVNRGICLTSGGYLLRIKEERGITLRGGRILSEDGRALDPDAHTSVNLWGFSPLVIDWCRSELTTFLQNCSPEEIEAAEFCLPDAVQSMIDRGRARVRVIQSMGKWIGITYASDLPRLCARLKEMRDMGLYDFPS